MKKNLKSKLTVDPDSHREQLTIVGGTMAFSEPVGSSSKEKLTIDPDSHREQLTTVSFKSALPIAKRLTKLLPPTTRLSIASCQLSIILLLLLISCKEQHTHTDLYTCPMHPTVQSDKPGSCPVCGMSLVRVAREGEEVKITSDLAKLLLSPNQSVVSSTKTTKGEYKSVPITIASQGLVTYDTRNVYTISARVSGRLEKVFLQYNFQTVTRGQKIAELFSPELQGAQRELLYLAQHDAENQALISAARNRLQLLGVTESQINDLLQGKEVPATISIYSPRTGYLITNDQPVSAPPAAPSTASGMNAMSSSVEKIPEGSSDLVREGSYVNAGQTIFRIVNPSSLRIDLNLPATQANSVKVGQSIFLDFENGKQQKATIEFIQPFFSAGESFAKVRAYTSYSPDLHIGHLVDARIELASSESLWIKREAVVDLGLDQIVFVKEREVLKPKKVTIGTRAGEWIEVKQGLSSSDELAANAQFLVDSESFITANNDGHRMGSQAAMGNDNLMLNQSQMRLANISTQKVSTQSIGQRMVVNARLVTDQQSLEVISSRVEGRIEKLFYKETGLFIQKGSPLYVLYSETLLMLQKEFLLALEEGSNSPLVEPASRKLIRYGFSQKQVDQLDQSKNAQPLVTIFSPATGLIKEINVSEGGTVSEGTSLYQLENTNNLWVEAELYQHETSFIKIGDHIEVAVDGYETNPVKTTVTFLTPEFRKNSQVVLMRASITNPGTKFKPGMRAQVYFTHSESTAVVIPSGAVIREGRGAHVFVQTPDQGFQPRMVKTGIEEFDKVEVLEGLNENDVVVVSGAYLLYSEMKLKHGQNPMEEHQH